MLITYTKELQNDLMVDTSAPVRGTGRGSGVHASNGNGVLHRKKNGVPSARELIASYIERTSGEFWVKEIIKAVRAQDASVPTDTIYNELSRLTKEGPLIRLEMGCYKKAEPVPA